MQAGNDIVPPAVGHGSRKKHKTAQPRQQKDQRNKKNRVKGKTGKLAGLLELPFDILLEIFGHLVPLDILHLARTTKQFRRVLMYRSSLSVWMSARSNVVGLPDCPPSMSEPKFANLVFDQHCHVCLRPNVRSVDWRLRLRLCATCSKTHLITVESSNFEYAEMVPSRSSKAHGGEVYYLAEGQAVQAHAESLDDLALKEYSQEREALVAEYTTYAELCENWAEAQALSRSEELEEARESRRQAIFEKLTELGWGEEIAQIPFDDDLKWHRLVKQPTRLTDRIWKNIKAPLMEYMEQMKTNRLERERKVIAIDVLRAYKISSLPWTDVMPEPVDFCTFPEIRTVFELPNDVNVDESTFSGILSNFPEMFDRWRGGIRSLLVNRFKKAQNDQVRLDKAFGRKPVIINQLSYASDDEVIDRLALATTVFKCLNCDENSWNVDEAPEEQDDHMPACHPNEAIFPDYPLFYPKVLGHHCLTVAADAGWGDVLPDDCPDPCVRLDMSEFGSERYRKKWSCRCLVLDSYAAKMASQIIRACGLDDFYATAEDMDAIDARLACLNCAERYSNKTVASSYAWRSALKHHALQHSMEQVTWMRLIGEAEKSARDAENTIYAQTSGENPENGQNDPPSDLVVWLCAHCMDLPCQQGPQELHKTVEHVKTVHNVLDPQLNIDYYLDFEAPQGYWTEKWPRISQIEWFS